MGKYKEVVVNESESWLDDDGVELSDIESASEGLELSDIESVPEGIEQDEDWLEEPEEVLTDYELFPDPVNTRIEENELKTDNQKEAFAVIKEKIPTLDDNTIVNYALNFEDPIHLAALKKGLDIGVFPEGVPNLEKIIQWAWSFTSMDQVNNITCSGGERNWVAEVTREGGRELGSSR